MKAKLKSLFDSVFWPAAAGNVFWSLFTLLLEAVGKPLDYEAIGRMAVLVLLTLYLSIEWVRNLAHGPSNPDFSFSLFDALHIWAVVLVALSAQLRPDLTSVALYAYFIINTVGHVAGVWKFHGDSTTSSRKMACINFVGIVALLVGGKLELADSARLPGSLLIMLMLWAFLGRRKQLQQLFGLKQ